MKRILLVSMAVLLGFAVVAQTAQLKSGLRTATYTLDQKIGIEPVKLTNFSALPQPSGSGNSDNPDVVTVLTIGQSANAYGYGYQGGQKTMVWADDDLKCLINLHRLGPGTTPPSFSGYLGVDLGLNMGQQSTDWTLNWQIYAATLSGGGTYYMDAARYPQAGIFKPAGATSVSDAYVAYFAPNLSNDGNWGGYSYGRTSLGDQSDSTKHLLWYTPPPYTYIPDGFTIAKPNVIMTTDIEQEWNGTTFVGYTGNLLLNRGVWNTGTLDFDYILNDALPCPTTDNQRPLTDRIAASPDGQTMWVVTLSNNGGAVQIGDFANYYPILFQSNDGGLTWSDPIAVQLDGPDGITGIVDKMLSDYRIEQTFTPPVPAREEIGYTTAWDCDLVVDKWGNPHFGVVIGLAADQDYAIITGEPGDSLLAVYDIYSTDDGVTWQGIKMGIAQTFDGVYGDLTEYNRVNIAINQAGDKVFLTWNDTQTGNTENIEPDVFARGFDLITNKITENSAGQDDCDNVTFLSDVFSQAYFECTSHYVFTDGNEFIIPIVTELLSDPTAPDQPVNFKYLSDFSYTYPDDFTILTGNPEFPTGIDNQGMSTAGLRVFPNPARETATLALNLQRPAGVNLEVTNTIGQVVISKALGSLDAGSHRIALDVSGLEGGVYVCSAFVNGERVSSKLMVE